MIIEINQTKSNDGIEFEITEMSTLIRQGKCSRLSKSLPIELRTEEYELMFKTRNRLMTNAKSIIPFKWAFPKVESRSVDLFDSNNKSYGIISKIQKGLFYTYDFIVLENTEISIYSIDHGSMQYLSVYKDDIQIAMITKSLKVKNNLDTYKLYLLDDYSKLQDVLLIYCLYYDNYNHADRTEIVAYKKEYQRSWTFSETDQFFNPLWLKKHFGLEEIEFEEQRKTVKKIAYSAILLICFIMLTSIYFEFLR